LSVRRAFAPVHAGIADGFQANASSTPTSSGAARVSVP